MKLCLVNHLSWTMANSVTGGTERQTMLMAEAMACRGHEVTCVAPAWAGPERIRNGVRAISGWDGSHGLKGLRWGTHFLPRLRHVLKELKADVYYSQGFSLYAPTVVSAAHSTNAQAWIALASDSDLAHHLGAGAIAGNVLGRWSNGRLASIYFVHRALKRADRVIAQNQTQMEGCRARGMNAALIRNIVPTPVLAAQSDGGSSADVVWVGSLSRWKGIGELDAIVERLPDISFEIVGPKVDPTLDHITDCLLNRKNVRWAGELPHDQVLERIATAKLFLNTSPQEGFANTMLEAWALGKPVLSLSTNPDGLLSGDRALGECAQGSRPALATAIRHWLESGAVRMRVGARAIQYVQDNHCPDSVCRAYERLLEVESAFSAYSETNERNVR